ncbi:MAG: NAD(P)/FAD-dependent oxidoreductase [Desulfarculus sp.]|nr:MAG: NAD(P)/FAD-dependent oxidoreductase [Desulfarculus sp.]
MSEYDFDLFVIGGGGSAGFTAVTTAMKSGAKVGMAEAGRLGGLCILAGCMPSKTLLHSAAEVRAGGAAGAAAYPEIQRYTRGVVDYLAHGREEAVAERVKAGLQVLRGPAAFLDPHRLSVGGREVRARRILIATGSQEAAPPIPGLAETGYLTSKEFLSLSSLPSSLIVLGGGAIALELAQFAARMGVPVSVIQRSDHLLSQEDPRAGRILAEALAEEGAAIHTGTEISQVRRERAGVSLRFTRQGRESQVAAEVLLLALGRRANTEGLNLEAAGVALGRRGQVKVDRFMRTSQAHIFAAGDVTGGPMVVNLAVEQGRAAGHNATRDQPREVNDRVLPRAVFTDPQFARVGLNQAEARAAGLEFVEADYDLGGMGTAKTYPQALRGYMCLRAEKGSGKIIGAELVAPEASLMIHDVAVCLRLGGAAKDLAAIPYIHPCLAEITQFTAGNLAKQVSG